MPANTTLPNQRSVLDFLAELEDPVRQADCAALVAIIERVTQCKPVMWGDKLVGFGSYSYRYASGHSGTFFLAGFSPRKTDLSVYLLGACEPQTALLAKLGKHKMGKSCLYIKRLSDIDTQVLEQLVQSSVTEVKRLYPAP